MRKTLAIMRDLELAMQQLYELYAVRFAAQRSFWQNQADQEAGHAAMIERVMEQSLWEHVSVKGFDAGQLETDLQKLHAKIYELEHRAELTALEAADIAIELEQNFSEVHSLKLAQQHLDPGILDLLDKLQADDVGHASAIEALRAAL